MSTARRCDSVILCTQGCMLKHSLGAFSSGKMTLGPNERDTSSITYCGRSLASSAPFRGGVVDIFPQNIHRYFMFFCMQDALPTRPKQACISVDKYNMQDFFWNVLFFLRKFFNFFCELFHRKFSILFIAYTFECYIEI